jgi:SDR family mycofactocin-dependent oxidoreductase
MGKLDGRVALISGGARGQGRSHALTLAREGADIIVFDICKQIGSVEIAMARKSDLDETADMIRQTGRRGVAMQGDVRDTASLNDVVSAGLKELGKIDIVVANAGILSFGPTEALPDDVWDDMIAVNLTGVYKTVRAALPAMIARKQGGAIVLTSSTAALRPYANHIHYVAAKHGVTGIMRALAHEMAKHRIRVNCVAPAACHTDFIINPTVFQLFTGNGNISEEEAIPAFKTLNLMDEPWIYPEDVSNAIAWLVSDEARFVTGITLPVDLGLTNK